MSELEKDVNELIGEQLPIVNEAAPIDENPPDLVPDATPPEPTVPPPAEPPVDSPHPSVPLESSIVVDTPPVVVEDPRDVQVKQMQETITALQQQIETVSRQATTQVQPAAPVNEPQKLIFLEKEEDLDKALTSVDNFNALLSNVIAKAKEVMVDTIEQAALRQAHQVYTQRSAAAEFYSVNPDLAGNKAYVGIVANELASANPTWTLADVMSKLGEEVRNRLKMGGIITPPPPQVPAGTPPPAPAFAGSGVSRPGGGAPSETPLAKEVADLLEGA